MLTEEQIKSVESAITAFDPEADVQSGASNLLRACREYLNLLRKQNPDAGKLQLASLQRINDSAFQSVLATIPEPNRAEITAYIESLKGKPLPTATPVVSVTEAIATGKLPPIKKNP